MRRRRWTGASGGWSSEDRRGPSTGFSWCSPTAARKRWSGESRWISCTGNRLTTRALHGWGAFLRPCVSTTSRRAWTRPARRAGSTRSTRAMRLRQASMWMPVRFACREPRARWSVASGRWSVRSCARHRRASTRWNSCRPSRTRSRAPPPGSGSARRVGRAWPLPMPGRRSCCAGASVCRRSLTRCSRARCVGTAPCPLKVAPTRYRFIWPGSRWRCAVAPGPSPFCTQAGKLPVIAAPLPKECWWIPLTTRVRPPIPTNHLFLWGRWEPGCWRSPRHRFSCARPSFTNA